MSQHGSSSKCLRGWRLMLIISGLKRWSCLLICGLSCWTGYICHSMGLDSIRLGIVMKLILLVLQEKTLRAEIVATPSSRHYLIRVPSWKTISNRVLGNEMWRWCLIGARSLNKDLLLTFCWGHYEGWLILLLDGYHGNRKSRHLMISRSLRITLDFRF